MELMLSGGRGGFLVVGLRLLVMNQRFVLKYCKQIL